MNKETVTENRLAHSARGEKFSARDEKIHIISIFLNSSFNRVEIFSPGRKSPYNQPLNSQEKTRIPQSIKRHSDTRVSVNILQTFFEQHLDRTP